MIKLDITFSGVEVGAEITEVSSAEATHARVRYYVTTKDDKKIYVSREDAMVLLAIDQAAWTAAVNNAISCGGE